jgi:phage-related protein
VTSERRGLPLSELVDRKHANLRAIGYENFARVFFFFQKGRQIIVTYGYMKKQRKVHMRELEQVRTYKGETAVLAHL